MKMPKCPKCGTEAVPTIPLMCPNCGARIPDPIRKIAGGDFITDADGSNPRDPYTGDPLEL